MFDIFILQPLILLSSILGWIGFFRFAKRKGYSALIAHGCGFIVGCVCFFVLGSLYFLLNPLREPKELPNQLSEIKPGMYFDLGERGEYLCSTKEKLAAVAMYVENKDLAGSDFCWGPALANGFKYEVDGISDVNGIGKVVVFHVADRNSANLHLSDNLKVKDIHMYTPMSFVKPWNNLAPTALNPKLRAADLKKDMRFTINNKEFIACESQEYLAKIGAYRASGDNDNIDRLLKEDACYGDDHVFPDDELTVLNVEEVDGIEDEVVGFNRTGHPNSPVLYTPIKFVNPSPAPTPSAAN